MDHSLPIVKDSKNINNKKKTNIVDNSISGRDSNL